jgi:hypothetical protein
MPNVYETWQEKQRRERNKRIADRLVGWVCVIVGLIAVGLSAWDAGRDYGRNEKAAECAVITEAWATLQSERKAK